MSTWIVLISSYTHLFAYTLRILRIAGSDVTMTFLLNGCGFTWVSEDSDQRILTY